MNDLINNNIMVNPTSPFLPIDGEKGVVERILLTEDAINIIFQKLMSDFANLPTLALVCKKWSTAIDDENFREVIRPKQIFGREEWQKFVGVDSGKELPLPRCAYSDLENDRGYLIFIPKKVKRVNDESRREEIVLDSLETIGNLFGLSFSSQSKGIMEIFSEESHWSWIGKEIIGFNKTFEEQEKIAKDLNAKISGVIDTTITIFAETLKEGSQVIVTDLDLLLLPNRVRVHDKFLDKRLCIHGYFVNNLFISPLPEEKKNEQLGFLLARKSF